MLARGRLIRILMIAGLIAMVVGAIDPLEGSIIILAGSGIVALSAFLAKSRHRRLLYRAFALIVIGVGAMLILSMLGGVGGDSDRSMWWALVVAPYPIGWIMGLVAAIRELVSSFKTKPV